MHYHLFDEQTFDTLVSGHTDVNRSGHSQFSSGDSSDAWAEAHDTRPADGEKKTGNVSPISFSKSEVKRSLYPTTSSSVINTCAGGYCLSLDITMKQQLRTGELVAVREKGQKNWLLAAVRWVQAKNKHQLLLGLELLSAATKPCAVTPLKKTMDTSHYQRAFLLPVIPHVNDMPTLITPKVPFKNGLKFILLQGSKIRRGQLLECVSSSPGYSQYQFRLLEDQF